MRPERAPASPISGRLRISILLTCATALFCASAAMFAVRFLSFRQEFWEEVRRDVTQVARDAAPALTRLSPEAAQRIVQTLRQQSHFASALVLSENGLPLASDGPFIQPGDYSQAITVNGRTLGVVKVQTTFAVQVARMLGVHVLLFVGSLLVAFLVSGPISARLVHSIFDPIRNLDETARQIAAREDYSMRAAKAGEDEMGAFTDTFNSMLAQIQRRDQELRREIAERARVEKEVQSIHEKLVAASRQAGMAEVATGVLHNVGNVLNSVNVSATLVAEKLDPERSAKLLKAANLLREQTPATLPNFLAHDPKGKVLPLYLAEVSAQLAADRAEALNELASLRRNIEHIKDIVATQQNHARITAIVEPAQITVLIDDALRMSAAVLERSRLNIEREFDPVPPVLVDRHQTLQIFLNLIRNAADAIEEADPAERRLTIRVTQSDPFYVCTEFRDTGSGIDPENLTRIFQHGFTTREHGHGFGLHSAALAAQQMAGCLSADSPGPGRGAVFRLELPIAQDPIATT